MQKINQQLHAQIRELFPLQKGKAIVIEILNVKPLQYSAKVHGTSDDLAEHAIGLMEEKKVYFVIDGLHIRSSVFFYRDVYVSLCKDYFTDKVIRFQYRDTNKKATLDQVVAELKKLKTLNSKAS